MAVGDWVAGSYIEIVEGTLDQLSGGEAGHALVNYNVVLPSGGTVYNGGSANLAPFEFQADDAQSIDEQGFLLVVGLAQHEGIPVQLPTYLVYPDGSTNPTTYRIGTLYLLTE